MSSNFAIQPLLPPRLDQGAVQYGQYLAAYDLYVAKVQQIRNDAVASRAAAKAARPPPQQPSLRPPALSEETRQKIGKAFSEGRKFGSLEFSAEELAASRKRWQTLSDRGRSRSSRPLNKKERAELRAAKPLAARAAVADSSLATWEGDVLPSVRRIMRSAGLDPNEHLKNLKPLVDITEVDEARTGPAPGSFVGDTAHLDNFTKQASIALADRLEKLFADKHDLEKRLNECRTHQARGENHLAAQIAKLKAEAELARSESQLKLAQTETQRRRAQLKKTVVERVSAHVIPSSSGMAPQVVMVPETTSTVESVLDAPAAAVEVQPRAKLPISIVDLDRDGRQSETQTIGRSFYVSDVSQTQREIRRQGRLLASEGTW